MLKTSLLFFTWLCVIAVTGVKAQSDKVRDSLLQILAHAGEDTGKVIHLIKLSRYYEASNQDSCSYLLNKAGVLAEKLHFKNGAYLYLERLSIVLLTKGDYVAALEKGSKALELARERKDSAGIINMLANLGIIYGHLGKYEAELDNMLQVKNILETSKDSSRLSPVYHNLGNCYANLFRYRKSVDYALLSIAVYAQYHKANAYINRAYSTAARGYEVLGKADSALWYYKKAIAASKALNDIYAEAAIYGYMSEFYGGRNQFADMLQAADAGLSLARSLQSSELLAHALNYMAYAQCYNGNYAKARTYINESLSICKRDSVLVEMVAAYEALSYIAVGEGHFSASILARHKADSIQKRVLNEQVEKGAADLEKKYETEKKEVQIKQLEAENIVHQLSLRQKNTWNIVLVGSAIALLVIFLLSYRTYRQRQALQQRRIVELEKESQLAATEAILRGEEQERTRLAKDLHDGLGGMLSGIKFSLNTVRGSSMMTEENALAFERSMDMLDSSIREMRRVAHNMMPETLVKFGLNTALRDFCNEINKTGALAVTYQSIGMEGAAVEQTTAIIIYRIVQELINNTMKHAAARKAIVQLTREDNLLSLTVEDDGKGFALSALPLAEGMGWKSIRNRVDFLKGRLDISAQPGKGTSVLIEFDI